MTLITISTILTELVVYKAFFFQKLLLIPLFSLWNFLIGFISFEYILGGTAVANQN